MPEKAVAKEAPRPNPGLARAAAVLLGLGPETASILFQQLGEPELRLIAQGAKELRKQPPAAVPDALRSFVTAMEMENDNPALSDQVLRDVAVKALGADKARRVFDEEPEEEIPPDEVLAEVQEADPDSLAMVLAHEQPQTIALVLSSISSERSALVIDKLPERMRSDILRRMAVIDSVAPEILREIGEALSSELKALVAGGMRKVNGKQVALSILRRCTAQQQSEVLAEIERDSAPLAAELKGRLFTFDDLKSIADRDMQTLLREIDTSKLAIALKGSTPELKTKVMANLSARAAEMLEDDMGAMGPIKLSTVETAQAEIAKLTLEVAQQGRITIVGANETML